MALRRSVARRGRERAAGSQPGGAGNLYRRGRVRCLSSSVQRRLDDGKIHTGGGGKRGHYASRMLVKIPAIVKSDFSPLVRKLSHVRPCSNLHRFVTTDLKEVRPT